MATLSGIPVADKNSPFDSGVAFLLAQKCNATGVFRLPSGWEVEVRHGSAYVVARIQGASSPAAAFNEGHEAAQEGLDLLSATGAADLSIRNATDEHLVWWREGSTQMLRVVSITNLSVDVGIGSVSVTDAHGNIPPPNPVPETVYHESLRYIRLSQVTEDVFDAFRNMYLAFEQLLSYIEPKHKKEGEGAWLRRALSTVNKTIALSNVFTPISTDIINDIYQQIYVDIRCALFHAKTGTYLLPHSMTDRKKVSDGLYHLTRIVLYMANHWLHTRRGGGSMTYIGFDMSTTPILVNSQVIVSDWNEPIDMTETLASPAYVNALPLATRHAPELSGQGINVVLGSIETAELQALQRIARFGLKSEDGLIMGATVEGELTYDSFDRLEALLGIQLRNVKEPKRFFQA